jgi:hypothetical protein
MSLISIEPSVTGTIGAVVGAIESALEPSPDVVAVATVPTTSADLTGDQVAKALPGLAAIFAWLAEESPAIQAGAKIAERIASLAALFDVPGCSGGRTRDRARGRGYSDRSCGGAARVATVDDAGLSRGLNQSERMERRGEPEPLSRAIVDQGFEIAHFATKDAGGSRILRLRQRDSEAPRAMAPARPHSRRESVGRPNDGRRRRFRPWPNIGRAEPRSGVTTEKEIFRLAKP